MKLLFHCCCGPCATACIKSLSDTDIAPVLFWYNPNIHPLTEYNSRRGALAAFAAAKNLQLDMIDEYGLRFFLKELGSETEAPERCHICYRLRLEQTARYAAEHGFDAFSTSLLVSPYQQHDVIRSLGEEAAAQYGVEFLYRDFRPGFREGQNDARALGLYMQKYCGCVFSEDTRKKAQRQAVSFDIKQYGESPKNDHCDQKGKLALASLAGDKVYPKMNSAVNPLFQRLTLITGEEFLQKLARTSVLIFGVGGVGSWCAEALVRCGVGKIGMADYDTVCESNVNRQVQATSRTLGKAKVDVLRERLLEINPNCEVSAWEKTFSKESAAEFSIEKADYVIDAIDSLTHKLDLIELCHTAGVKLFSSMGMGWKLDPTRLKTGSIWETRGCPLARLVRQGLRKRGFSGSFTVVYSEENSRAAPCHDATEALPAGKKIINGSAVTVTATAGMVLASLVLQDMMGGA